MVASGAGIGLLNLGLDRWLIRRGSGWRAPVLAVAIGIYLPLELSIPILIGGLIAHAVARAARREAREPGRAGVLFAAGLITGEALIGIAAAVPIVVSGDANVLALGVDWPVGIGIAVVSAIALYLYRSARVQ